MAIATALNVDVPIERLRWATRELHQQLEHDLDVVGQLSVEPARSRLLARYRAFYGGADAVITRWVLRTTGVEDVFRADRYDTDCLPQVTKRFAPAKRPTVESREEALGFLYVVEGSALGGKLILRQLAVRGADLSGLGFLDPHGDQAGPAWRRFLALLDRELSGQETSIAAAVTGAVKGFAFARSCLVAAREVA